MAEARKTGAGTGPEANVGAGEGAAAAAEGGGGVLLGVGLVSAALLMTELALTRVFSVTMYYHFAFLAISIALFGLSASGVYVYLARHRLASWPVRPLLAVHAAAYLIATTVALAVLVRLRVGLNYSPRNLLLMLVIYALAALPFFTGGAVISLAISRLARRVNLVYAVDLGGAAAGCLVLLPLLDRLGAPGVVLTTAAMAAVASVLFAGPALRRRVGAFAVVCVSLAWAGHLTGLVSFDVADTKGHQGDRVLFSKWNSFSRVAVYDRHHGDWSLSPRYQGPLPESRFMDIDSAASTPILRVDGDPSEAAYLRYELTALAYHLRAPGAATTAMGPGGLPGAARDGNGEAGHEGAAVAASNGSTHGSGPYEVLVIGPGGGRDLISALVFGASRVDGVEINPIIANDVMRQRFRDYSGRIYADPRVRIFVEDGRSFVRRSPDRYDVIQASLVDTWAATAAGAYTLTENSLYTVEAFGDYLDHLDENGVLTITRWVFDGLRLVSLAQDACAARGWDARDRLAVIRQDRVATFLLKRTPFTAEDVARLERVSGELGFTPLYLPGRETEANDYARLITTGDRERFYLEHPQDVRATTDDRPFFFHTTKLKDQTQVAFGRSMLFGNGLSALLTLMGISGGLVGLFVLGPLALSGRELLGSGWPRWLAYFGLLGAGFMLIEVALLQRFVLLLGHPVYSLTVTLFSLLVGGGLGSFLSRRVSPERLTRTLVFVLGMIVGMALVGIAVFPDIIRSAMSATLWVRIGLAVSMLAPVGLIMGVPLPAGVRLLNARRPQLIPWAWAMNGALSVMGATLAVFIAMNWGFSTTLMAGAGCYAAAAVLAWGMERA